METFLKNWLSKGRKLVIPLVGIVALILFSYIIINELTKVSVSVTSGEGTEIIETHASTVGELIEEIGLELGEHDEINPSLDTPLEKDMKIVHKRAKEITLIVNGIEEKYYTTTETVDEFLKENHLVFRKEDHLSFQMTDPIREGLVLTADLAFPVTIFDANERKTVWTTKGKVKDILNKYDIALKKYDEVEPTLEQIIDEKSSIYIIRVKKEKETIEQKIAFNTKTIQDNTLEKGKEKVVEEGKPGVLTKTFEVIKENGEEVKRKLVKEEVKENPKDRIIAVGTKVNQPKQSSSNGGNLVTLGKESNSSQGSQKTPSGRIIIMDRATAYTANCTGCRGITAYGINLKENRHAKVISVDPNVIPLGTRVWVEGYGYAIAGDTGGAIQGKTIDLHMPTREEALKYGMKRNVKVILLD